MKFLLLVALYLISETAHALDLQEFTSAKRIYNYNYWYPRQIDDYLNLIDNSSVAFATPKEGSPECQPVFQKALDKQNLDIRYALGYFDDSQAKEIIYDGQNWGLSPSLDIEIFHVLRMALTKKCEGNKRLCGFVESGNSDLGKVILEKNIQLYGKTIAVKLTLTQASATEYFEKNKNEFKEKQSQLTQQSEENYFGGLNNADIIFYNGHSRNGGGPDFNPPRLDSGLHVDYGGYYQVQKPGITRFLNIVKSAQSNKSSVVGFFSCYSQRHFYDRILKANPKQRMILSSDTINYLDSLLASVGYLEGLMRGQCGQNLADLAKQTDSVKAGFKGFQIR